MAGFDGSLGWGLDAGRAAGDSFRIVQLTPPETEFPAIVPISTVQCHRSAADRHGDHRHASLQQRVRDLRDPPHPARYPWLRPRPGAPCTEGRRRKRMLVRCCLSDSARSDWLTQQQKIMTIARPGHWPQPQARPGRAVLTGVAAASGGFWSGLVARIVKSCPDRSRPAGQGTASVFQGRDGPAPSVMLRSLPARR